LWCVEDCHSYIKTRLFNADGISLCSTVCIYKTKDTIVVKSKA
jgi:hypothetical protein